jgi:hypothetical protein
LPDKKNIKTCRTCVNNVGQAFYDEKRKYLLPYCEEFIVNNFTAI